MDAGPVRTSMDDTVTAAKEVLDTIERHYGRPLRLDAALVMKVSLQTAVATATACGAINPELCGEIHDRIRKAVLSAVQETMALHIDLLLRAHSLSEEDGNAVAGMIIKQVDRGLVRLNAALQPEG